MKHIVLPILALIILVVPSIAQAGNDNINLVGVQGYDLVSYHQGDGSPQKGDGNNLAYHDGVTYLFANAKNQKAFEANPTKYLPAYGGYCAFGVTKSKKFIGDPLAYKVVDGALYLNLSKKVQKIWVKDIPGNISTADTIWPDIANEHASDL